MRSDVPNRHFKFTRVFLAVASLGLAAPVHAATYAPWLSQIGITDAIESAANWGKGQLLVTVDTGIVASNAMFAPGQVSNTLSSCAAVTFRCTNGVNDDNSHGTAVAAIAAAHSPMPFAVNYGGYSTAAGSVVGVAPNANIAAEKVLNASGAGYSTDVANGLVKAANAGASVINLSLTFGNTPDLISAINYAAGKGAFIVWAGGNSAAALLSNANTLGLSDAAIAHLVFAGSVSAKNTLSSFSNTPGTGSLVNTAGVKTTYASRWVMAPGENILAPAVTSGNGAFGAWSGTSMSAPIISGSLVLLESAWPILKTNGTAANLLLGTATDLGSKGIDNSYGNGIVNLGTAFQPFGGLNVLQANGKLVSLTGLTGSIIAGGALGSLQSVQSKLANYTALDAYQRNFAVNLSGLIQSKPSAATLNALPTNTNTGPNKMSLANGSELAYQLPVAASNAMASLEQSPIAGQQAYAEGAYAMLTDSHKTTIAFGFGDVMPVTYSFNKALYGSNDAALSANNLSLDLGSLTQGGYQMAYGLALDDMTRIALSYSDSDRPKSTTQHDLPASWATPVASSIGIGMTRQLSTTLMLGVSLRSLDEQHGLMGSAYDASSALSLGKSNHSEAMAVSAMVMLDPDRSLYMELSQVNTAASSLSSDSVFASRGKLTSNAWGFSFDAKNQFSKDDRLSASVKQPLRVASGSVAMAVTNIDANTGVPSVGLEHVSLAPTGREIDYRLAYDKELSKLKKISLQASYTKDQLNSANNNVATVGLIWSMRY